MLVLLPVAIAHDPELAGIPAGAILPDDRPLAVDAAAIRHALTEQDWRCDVIHAGDGTIEQVLWHPATDAHAVAALLADAFTDAAQALQFNGIDSTSFLLADRPDPATALAEGDTRPLHSELGGACCQEMDRLIVESLLDDQPTAAVVQLLRQRAQRTELDPDDTTPGQSLGEALFG